MPADRRERQTQDWTIRAAAPSDVADILRLIKELSVYERLAHEVTATETLLHENLFGRKPIAECLIAQNDCGAIGFALFFHNFSTFIGRPGIYLEDLYVQPEHRGRGIGEALL